MPAEGYMTLRLVVTWTWILPLLPCLKEDDGTHASLHVNDSGVALAIYNPACTRNRDALGVVARVAFPVRLEFPILSLNTGRRQRCVPPIA